LSKYLLHIAFIICSFSLLGQNKPLTEKEKLWQSEKDYLKYQKNSKYDGPEDWYGGYPANMENEDYVSTNSGGGNSSKNLNYNPQQIQDDRDEKNGTSGSGGNLQFDPTVERPDPLEIPEIDINPLDIDAPDIDLNLPDWDLSISQSFWKMLLFILIFAAVFIVAYLIIKNRKPGEKKIIVDVEDEWNPEVISKTELELRLEQAIHAENYRECIRIYFTFILKELIRKNWILWKKDKTNHHYVMEMGKRANALQFNECVRVYDLVWYGDYQIDKDIYELLKPTLESYYKSLDPVHE